MGNLIMQVQYAITNKLQRKIKLGFIVSSLTKEGPVQVLLDIVRHINYDEFEVSIIELNSTKKNKLYEEFMKFPINYYNLEINNKYNIIKMFYKYNNIMKINKFDIIHSHCFRSLFLNSLLSRKYLAVHTVHNYPGSLTFTLYGYYLGWIINYFTKIFLKKVNYPIACSKSVADELKNKDNINITFISNGIYAKNKQKIEKKLLRKKLKLEENTIYFISVGRLSKEKNYFNLIENYCSANLVNSKLIILGEGKEISNLQIQKRQNVELLGFKSNVEDYLMASDYYVSASYSEGLPLSVLEGMSVGLPLILSNILPHQYIFQSAGTREIGLLFDVNDKSSLKNAFLEISLKKYDEMSINVKETFYKSFTSQKMSNNYQNLYKNIIFKSKTI